MPESRPVSRSGGIYVASRVKHAPIWLDFRDRKGFPISASWIDEAADGQTADFGELWQRIRAEISRSDVLVFFAAGVQDFPFKGALVEVGVALAMGKPVFVALHDVMIEGRTARPVGSWIWDRNVRMFDTLAEAMSVAYSFNAAPQADGLARRSTNDPDRPAVVAPASESGPSIDRDAIIEECAQVGWNASMNGAPVAYAIRMLKGKK